jgi:hypothetical protein
MSKYFVSYSFTNKAGSGFGDTTITVHDNSLLSEKLINEMKESIKVKANNTTVSIVNVIKLEDESV